MKINAIAILVLLLSPQFVFGEFSLFGNVTVRDDSEKNYQSNPFLESLDLFYAKQYNNKSSMLVEFVAENSKDAQSAEIERINVGYQFSPWLKGAVGRFHTPIGRWNREMHHGRILHDTAERPFFLAFHESTELEGIMPVHVPGLMFTGNFESPENNLSYEFLVGSSQQIDTSDTLDPESHAPEYEPPSDWQSDHLGYSVRGIYAPKAKNWSLGLSIMSHTPFESGDKIDGAITEKGTELLRQEIVGIDMKASWRRWDVLAEVFRIRNRTKVLERRTDYSTAYYIQTGFRFQEDLKIIYRYARLNFTEDDLFYVALNRHQQYHNVLTARFDINEFHTLKLEMDFQRSQSAGLEDLTTYRIQWSFMVP